MAPPYQLLERMPAKVPLLLVWLALQTQHVVRTWPGMRRLFSDRFFCFLQHVAVVRRLPARRPFYNDVYYHVKTSGLLGGPLLSRVTDKDLMKAYVTEILGEGHVVPTIAILTTAEQVHSFTYPTRCCIKPTHSCGQFINRKAGEPLDLTQIASWLKINYHATSGEVNYRDLTPKIIVEELVFDNDNPIDIKIHCIAGKARWIEAVGDRRGNLLGRCFDHEWNEQPFIDFYLKPGDIFERPRNLAAMVAGAERLARDFFGVRVDCYTDGESYVVGEITTCPSGAMATFTPPEAEVLVSKLLFEHVTQAQWESFFTLSPLSA